MPTETTATNATALTATPDRLFVEVPWNKAEVIRDRLAKHGIVATACFEPYNRATIELPGNVDKDLLSRLL